MLVSCCWSPADGALLMEIAEIERRFREEGNRFTLFFVRLRPRLRRRPGDRARCAGLTLPRVGRRGGHDGAAGADRRVRAGVDVASRPAPTPAARPSTAAAL